MQIDAEMDVSRKIVDLQISSAELSISRVKKVCIDYKNFNLFKVVLKILQDVKVLISCAELGLF